LITHTGVISVCEIESNVACVNILDLYKAKVAPLKVDDGGTWTITSPLPQGSSLSQSDLIGDNPCLDFEIFGCGAYVLRYTYESSTCGGCTTFADVDFYKCCLSLSPICN